MGSAGEATWKQLDIGVIGGGLGGFAAALSLRRAGHKVVVYERAHFAGEVGASISCAANGTRWLEEWNVDVSIGKPVILRNLISRDWDTGGEQNVYDLGDYKEKWGYVYYMFHRQDMHKMLMEAALGEGEGIRPELKLDHKLTDIDFETGRIKFENGTEVQHDAVVAADGVGSTVRARMGIVPDKKPCTSTCLHANVDRAQAQALGLPDYASNDAIEYWGGYGDDKIVFSPCHDGKILSFYCFFPRGKGKVGDEGWNYVASLEELLDPYPELDPNVIAHLKISTDIRPWRLWIHQEYPFWAKGVSSLMGDAAHPMMPDQSQGACQAIEDAAALGLVFSKDHFRGDVPQAFKIFEEVRKRRATKVQSASARARLNITERIGFSSNTSNQKYSVADEHEKLTIDEMNTYDMKGHVADVYRSHSR